MNTTARRIRYLAGMPTHDLEVALAEYEDKAGGDAGLAAILDPVSADIRDHLAWLRSERTPLA